VLLSDAVRAVTIIIGNIAELERNLIIERLRAGMWRAKLEGRHIGRALLSEWFVRISADLKNEDTPAARLNTHAMRVALHLAWLRGHANILESDVDAGIKVADFQAKMRDFYRPAEGETREAQWEARIMKVMRSKRSLTHRELQKLVGASRAGTAVWERAIAGLRRDGRIAVVDEASKAGQKRKVVKLLKQRE
jgi:hypothetical protein